MPVARIGFYGPLAEIFGREREVATPAAGLTIAELRTALARLVPAGEAAILRPGIRAAIDDRFVGEEAVALPGQRVEFMSPLSGG